MSRKKNFFILTIFTAISLLLMSTNAFAVVQNYPSDYGSCYMLYHDYQPDDFCNASDTPTSQSVRDYQTSYAKKLFQKAYNTTSNPRYTNMWGTYSSSQKGAHEGLDMVYGGTGQPIYNWGIYGTVIKVDSSVGLVAIYCAPLDKTIFYRHMDSIDSAITVGATVSSGQQIGTQGSKGNSDGTHLHTGVEEGNDSTDSSGRDSYFTSANIYDTMYYVLHG